MTAVGNVGAIGATSLPSATTAAPPVLSSLLPEPEVAGGDSLSMLYLFQSESQQMGLTSSQTDIKSVQKQQDAAVVKEQSDLNKAAEAARHKSFWQKIGSICGDVAKVGSVVASIAAAVATCGAATPIAALAIAGAVLSTAGFVASETNVLQKLGVSDKLANILDTVMSVGGGLMSMGAASAAQAASTMTTTAAIVSGAGSVGQGTAKIATGYAQRNEDSASADAVADESTQDQMLRVIKQLIAEAKNADSQSSQQLGTIAETKGMQNATAEMAASLKG